MSKETSSVSSFKKTGYVKWFNPVRGYGFITSLSDPDRELFVHHTDIQTQNNIYKTLTTGEYIEYQERVEKNKYYANNITGIMGGKLLCEYKNYNKKKDKT
jgi:cold shock CspA family protein